MNKSQAMVWIIALRDGKYKQGEGSLHNKSDNTFCCLGVLNDIYPELNLAQRSTANLLNYGAIGLEDKNGYLIGLDVSLTDLNDGFCLDLGQLTFDEIADVIQAYYVEDIEW